MHLRYHDTHMNKVELYCSAFCNTYTNKSSTNQSCQSGISYGIEALIGPRVSQGGVNSDALISDKHLGPLNHYAARMWGLFLETFTGQDLLR